MESQLLGMKSYPDFRLLESAKRPRLPCLRVPVPTICTEIQACVRKALA